MGTTMQTRKPVAATPARWQAALRRAFKEGVQVRQLAGCGAWIATSGTDAATAYVVNLGKCECAAGEQGDPVCEHQAGLAHSCWAARWGTGTVDSRLPSAELPRPHKPDERRTRDLARPGCSPACGTRLAAGGCRDGGGTARLRPSDLLQCCPGLEQPFSPARAVHPRTRGSDHEGWLLEASARCVSLLRC